MKSLGRNTHYNLIQSNQLLTLILLISFLLISNFCLADPQKGEIKKISSGGNHICAVKTDDGLYCWGWNIYGQLGDGTNTTKNTPPSTPILTDVKEVSVGGEHTCAIKTDGGLYCWGRNNDGQLGDGTNTTKNTPPSTPILTDVKEVSLGGEHTCAIKTDGGLYCWGNNGQGQLGDGTKDAKNTPPSSPVLSDVKDVSLGDYHTCAIETEGELYCWGWNAYGDFILSPSPVLSDVKDVSLGRGHTCTIKTDGGLYCWGANLYGQLGDGTTMQKYTPPLSPILTDVKEISLGEGHTCAVKTDGGLYCWGYNGKGQLGDGTTIYKNTPPLSPVLTDVKEVSLGGNQTCAMQTDGGLYCWGNEKNTPQAIFCTTDTDGDGVLDCQDGCPNDPKNKELNPPEEGCFVNNSEVPEKYDPKVEPEPEHIVTPQEKLLPVYVVKEEAKAVIYLERFAGAAFQKIETLMAILKKINKKTTYRHEVRIAARNKKTGYRTTNTKKLKSNKTTLNLKLAKNTIYTIKYRIIIKQGKKEKATKWSKAVKVKK